MGEKLKMSPLVEAVCEFQFDSSGAWDWIIPGQFYEKVRAEFPNKTQLQGLGVALQAGDNSAQVATMQTGPERVQLKRADGSAMVQVGPHLLAINHLKPYPQWEQFKALALQMLDAYKLVSKELAIKQKRICHYREA